MNRKRRGSVAVLAMVMTVSTTALALALVALSGSVRTKETRLEDRRTAQDAFDGAVDTIVDRADRGVLVLPDSLSLRIGDSEVSVDVSDATGLNIDLLGISVTTSAYAILVDASVKTAHGTYKYKRVIGRGRLSSPWYQALYLDEGLTTLRVIKTGSPGLEGDAWFNGSVTFLGLGTSFDGDLTATGLILPLTVSVSGKKTASSRPIAFPTVVPAQYSAVATTTYSTDKTFDGLVFVSPGAGAYPLIFVNGNLTIKGDITGSGVIFATRVTINGNVRTGVNDHVVIITNGNMDIDPGANSIDAYLYCGNKLTIGTTGTMRSFLSGVVTKSVSIGDNVTFSCDPYVRDNPAEAFKLKLPGFWP
ncbi:MAG: hypothetical protein JST30_02135 [Armatimonadetes bacterium]|nr:hypothetical protein [Armatimonadota bacterium]